MPERATTSVTFREGGWPKVPADAHYPGFKVCGTQNIAPCGVPPVWKVETRRRGLVRTGYYCDRHLSDEDRKFIR